MNWTLTVVSEFLPKPRSRKREAGERDCVVKRSRGPIPVGRAQGGHAGRRGLVHRRGRYRESCEWGGRKETPTEMAEWRMLVSPTLPMWGSL